jgi:hypothetical protein
MLRTRICLPKMLTWHQEFPIVVSSTLTNSVRDSGIDAFNSKTKEDDANVMTNASKISKVSIRAIVNVTFAASSEANLGDIAELKSRFSSLLLIRGASTVPSHTIAKLAGRTTKRDAVVHFAHI